MAVIDVTKDSMIIARVAEVSRQSAHACLPLQNGCLGCSAVQKVSLFLMLKMSRHSPDEIEQFKQLGVEPKAQRIIINNIRFDENGVGIPVDPSKPIKIYRK